MQIIKGRLDCFCIQNTQMIRNHVDCWGRSDAYAALNKLNKTIQKQRKHNRRTDNGTGVGQTEIETEIEIETWTEHETSMSEQNSLVPCALMEPADIYIYICMKIYICIYCFAAPHIRSTNLF